MEPRAAARTRLQPPARPSRTERNRDGAAVPNRERVYVVIRLRFGVTNAESRPQAQHFGTEVAVEGVYWSREAAIEAVAYQNNRHGQAAARFFWQAATLAESRAARRFATDITVRVAGAESRGDGRWAWLGSDREHIRMSPGLLMRVKLLRWRTALAGMVRTAGGRGRSAGRWFRDQAVALMQRWPVRETWSRAALRQRAKQWGREFPRRAADGIAAARAYVTGPNVRLAWAACHRATTRLRQRSEDLAMRLREKLRQRRAANRGALARVSHAWLVANHDVRRFGRSWSTRVSITLIARAIGRHASQCGYEVRVSWFGAYQIDPGQLVFWLSTDSEEEKAQMQRDEAFWAELRALLVRYHYPEHGRERVYFGVDTKPASGLG